jgi:hypothetical protein
MKPQDRTRAILRSTLDAESRLVAIALADHMNVHDEAYPSVGTLAIETALSERTVQGVIRHGLAHGWLSARGASGKPRTMSILWSHLSTQHPPRLSGGRKTANPRTGRTGAPAAPVHGAHPTPARGAPPPPQGAHPRGARGAPEACPDEATTEAPSRGGIEPDKKKPPARAEPPIPGGAYANWRPPTITFAAPAPAPVAEPAPPPPPTRREPPELLCDLLGDASMGRTARALAYAGITPAVLVRMTKRDLRYTSGIGGAWRVIADACERAGWPLSGPDPDDDTARPGARPPPSGPFDFDDYATWPETFDGARFETWPEEVKNGQIPIPRDWWRQIPDSHKHLKTVRAHG